MFVIDFVVQYAFNLPCFSFIFYLLSVIVLIFYSVLVWNLDKLFIKVTFKFLVFCAWSNNV